MVEVVVGRVGRPHGVRGEVSVSLLTDEPTRRFQVGAVLAADDRILTCVSVRPHQDRLLITFAEVPDRSAAKALSGALLRTEVAADEDPGEADAWFDHQLVGLRVKVGERDIGAIDRVDHGAGQDLLVVTNAQGRSALVPFVSAIVPRVDIAGGVVVLSPPAGLLDDLEPPDEPVPDL